MAQEVNYNKSGFPSVYKGTRLLPRPSNSAPPFLSQTSCFSYPSSSSSEDRTAHALRIHSQAEKRRRERINAHLSTLRRMIPDTNKMDKAALLGKVIEQVKELKRKATETIKGSAIPSETNEVIVEFKSSDMVSNSGRGIFYIKASVCCNDRPNLLAELMQAFQGLRLRTIRADITTLGGRVRNVFVLCKEDSHGSVCLNSLRESIREVLSGVAGSDVISGKRQRLMQSYYCNTSL